MNPVVKEKWLQALRSGEYRQGSDGLKRLVPAGDRTSEPVVEHCCLGVLCELAAQEGVVEELPGEEEFVRFQDPNDVTDVDSGVLPSAVETWAGLNGPNPIVRWLDNPTALSDLNDREALSFEEIADLIEEQL